MTAHASLRPDDLNLEVSGPDDGDPVLLLHGWGSSAALMRPVARALDDAYRVYNVDLPGHGKSPLPPAPWGVPDYAALVRELIDRRIGRPATVFGHSNGGRIALHMAADDEMRSRIARLVLVSPSGVPRRRTWKYYARSYTAKALKAPFELLPEGELRDFTFDWLRHSLVWKALGSSDYASLEGVMRETFVKTVNHYVDDRLGRIAVPTLLFWGDQDPAIDREQMRTLEDRIPDAGLVVLEGAGHFGYTDQPDVVAAATRHFLEHTPEAAATPQ